MKWLLITLGVYAIGCLTMFLLFVFARIRDGKWTGDGLLVIFVWPILIAAPVMLVYDAISNRKHRKLVEAVKKAGAQQIEVSIDNVLVMVKSAADYDPESVDICCRVLTGFKTGVHRTIPLSKIEQSFKQFWLLGGDPFDHANAIQDVFPMARLPQASLPNETPDKIYSRYRAVQEEWLIAMSREFIKAIQCIDRKLQGRILEAIAVISRDPMTVKGDTVKPLTHEMKGLWRYRLGDYRLVYHPLLEEREILLVNFDSRGTVYE